ncbi:unnamed protein product [Arabis nemorensis]|uniref:Uncharacterized protein n=1 Tax=Arabis nemorensis TaxID=586526 RepID=A0A565BAE3_9BRAS|nr:unnamed protein product [Arabis nemorensis]
MNQEIIYSLNALTHRRFRRLWCIRFSLLPLLWLGMIYSFGSLWQLQKRHCLWLCFKLGILVCLEFDKNGIVVIIMD